MRLLFLTPQLPFPPRQGTALRNWGLVRHLGARHALTLLSFAEPGQDPAAPELRAACAEVIAVPAPQRTRGQRLRGLLAPRPDLAQRLWSPAFAQALAGLLQRAPFDLVQIEGLEMAPYLELIRAGSRARVIYDAHNVEYVLQARAWAADLRRPARWHAAAYSLTQWPRLRPYEAAVCRAADGVMCVSETDAAALKPLAPGRTVAVAPNGLDMAEYETLDIRQETLDRGLMLRGEQAGARQAATGGGEASQGQWSAGRRVVFTGKLDYRPNVDAVQWFVRAIWPRLRQAHPELEFVVVGQKPAPALQRLDGREGVRLTGAVPDVRPYVATASVYVAPLRMGGGTRLKLLEAMALRRPIVSTTLGAEGFDVCTGRELLLADTPAEFAAAVDQLLADPAHAAALGLAGHAFAARRYDWSAILPAVEALYAELASGRDS